MRVCIILHIRKHLTLHYAQLLHESKVSGVHTFVKQFFYKSNVINVGILEIFMSTRILAFASYEIAKTELLQLDVNLIEG